MAIFRRIAFQLPLSENLLNLFGRVSILENQYNNLLFQNQAIFSIKWKAQNLYFGLALFWRGKMNIAAKKYNMFASQMQDIFIITND